MSTIESLQRYEESNGEGGGVWPSRNGDYVKISDDRAALAASGGNSAPSDCLPTFAFEDDPGFIRRLDLLLNSKYTEMRKDALAQKISELANEFIHGYYHLPQILSGLRHDALFDVYAAKLKERGYTAIEADSFGLMAVARYAQAASAPNAALVAALKAVLRVGRGSSGRLILEKEDENAIRFALSAAGQEVGK